MKTRQISILKKILNADAPVSITALMQAYGKSERSIRYDILQIRDELENYGIFFGSKSGEGYYIPEKQKLECRSLINSKKFTEVTIRNDDLAVACFALLYKEGGPKTLEELADATGGSRGTIAKALKDFNASNDGFALRSGRKGVILEGQEYLIRAKAMQYGKQIIGENNALNEKVGKAIKHVNELFDVWLTSDGYQDLKLYCEISLIRKKTIGTSFDHQFLQRDEKEYAHCLLEHLEIEDSDKELSCLSERLIHDQIILTQDGLLQQKTMVQTEMLIDRLIRYSAEEGIHVDRKSLKKDLSAHLTSFAKCLSYGIKLPENPMLMNIKTSYRSYFEIAKKASRGWKAYKDEELSESEIAYVAIYLYKNSKRGEIKRKRALILCATGKGLSNLLASRIKDRFPEIDVIGVESVYHAERDAANADFVISTLPVEKLPRPSVIVSPVLTDEDIKRIERFLNDGEHAEGIAAEASTFVQKTIQRQEMLFASQTIASILLAMTDLFATLPIHLQLDSDRMLAMLMHLYLAIPRWCEGNLPANENAAKKKIEKYEREAPDIASLMNRFFIRIEKILGFELYAGEKAAFYLYVLNERG